MNHLKSFLFCASLILTSTILYGQDRIYRKNGDIIESKVKEINSQTIIYKRFNNLEGPDYSILRNETDKIVFQNGVEEKIFTSLRNFMDPAQVCAFMGNIRVESGPGRGGDFNGVFEGQRLSIKSGPWNEIINPKIISQQALSEIVTSQKLNNGYKTGYGIGFSVETSKNGTPKYYHTGGGIGASTILLIYPQEELVITVLTNLTGVSMKEFANQLEAYFMD